MKFVCLMLCAGMATAASITTRAEVNCGEGLIQAFSCSSSSAQAEAFYFYTFTEAEFEFSASASVGTDAFGAPVDPDDPEGPRSPAEAGAGASVEFHLQTLGPSREGFVDLMRYTDGCADSFFPVPNGPRGPHRYEFTLGTSFSGLVAACGQSYFTGSEQNSRDASGAAGISFRMYEADGVTPVPLYFADESDPLALPEPSTAGLLSVGFASVLSRIVSKRAARARDGNRLHQAGHATCELDHLRAVRQGLAPNPGLLVPSRQNIASWPHIV
jgi:hypothetical protein